MAFIFDASQGETPQSIARQREIAAALLGGQNVSAPTSTGAGIGNAFASIARGLSSRAWNGQADASEAAGMESANKAYRDAIAASLSTGQPMTMPSAPTAPQGAAPAGGAPQAGGFNGTQEQFVSMLLPAAIEASKETGIDPRIIVAQAAQETGWGKSVPGNNYFGIKSHGMPGGNVLATSEHVNGQKVPERASFRAYASPEDSVKGYSSFIQTNPRYKPLMQAQGLDAQLSALQASGYATDPNYAASVGSIARKIPVSGADQPQMPENAQATQMPPPQQQAPSGGGDRLRLIADALSNPFLAPGQRAVLQDQYNREMEARDPMRQLQMRKLQQQVDAPGSDESFYGNPVPIQNSDGSVSYGQIGNRGTFKPIKLGEGQSFAPPTRTIDAGNEVIMVDQAGNVISRTPKNSYQPAYDAASGRAQGDAVGGAVAAAPGDIQAGQNALDLIGQIRQSPSRERGTGFSSVFNRIPGTAGYDFQNIVEQAKGGAFLNAIQQMRGLGALSNAEGQAATSAITRMDTATSEEAFMNALSDYEKIVQQGVARAQSRMGGQGGGAAPVSAAAPTAAATPSPGKPATDYRSKYGLD